ncbi:LRG1 protein [Mucor ambiguus]|uniref:LRG1 protein n=1 Tax=Mucor ambiguus TaxID=91626 RepID=A0A0C9MGG8_9FUNG|nr:LRG1 protein [Mucor ambiguus]
MIYETHCAGCDQAILKQFVEHVNLPNQIWHPECYMIFKFWGAKLAPKNPAEPKDILTIQNQIERKVTRVWTDLSSFEESSANCISDMLLNVAADAYIEGIRMANQFIMHLEVLFNALDGMEQTPNTDLHCNNEASLICKQMIRFFQLLTAPPNETSITQELLSLVTGLAQNLKSLIRIGLSAALNLERECHVENAIPQFLNQLLELEKKRVWIAGRYWFKDPPATTTGDYTAHSQVNICCQCQSTIQDTDYYTSSHWQWHPSCFQCSKCTAALTETSALLLENALYCSSCCELDTNHSSIARCTHVTLLQQNLNQLKAYMSTMSTKSTPVITSNLNGVKTSPNQALMPETKRQRSILRVLGSRQQQQHRSNRLNSVHLGQIGRTSSTTLKDSAPSSLSRKKGGDLMISTDTTNSPLSQQQQPHSSAALSSPISPVVSPLVAASPSSITKGGRFTQSIRRTFSTSSQYSGKHRPSLYNVFQPKKREPRRASVLTIDESGHTSHKYVQLSTLTPSQDFIVRHAAVIAIEPLMSAAFSLDELIDLIDEKKKKKKRTYTDSNPPHYSQNPASALWGKLITHIKASSSSSTSTTITSAAMKHNGNKTFGVTLAMVAQRDRDQLLLQPKQDDGGVTLRDYTPALAASFSDNALIPIFVKSCVMVILQSDMSIEGVFRKNGNIRQLRTLSESIDQLRPATTSMATMEELLANQNAIQLAALLKRYLRELPEPLLTFSLYKLFVQCGRIVEDQGQKKKALHLACCLLPKANRDTVIMLFCCLKWVSTFSDTNKMDIPNLARVIAPSVLFDRPSQTSSASIAAAASAAVDLRQGAQEEINVIETLIREVDDLSIIPSDLTIFTLHDINQDMTDLNSRYFVHHYQQLITEMQNQRSKSENNSPVTPTSSGRKLTQSTLLLKHYIGIPKPLSFHSNNNSSSSPKLVTQAPSTKQRRTSWIPGLK